MSKLILSGDTSGTVTIDAPAIAGLNTMTLAAATGTLSPKVLSTAVASTSGTAIDFTSIPSWVTRITVMFRAVSTNGSSAVIVQLGTSSGVETSNYIGSGDYVEDNNSGASMSAGFFVDNGILISASAVRTGMVVINLMDSATWVANGNISNQGNAVWVSAGYKILAATLDRVRVTATNGTDTFDAGTISIMYE